MSAPDPNTTSVLALAFAAGTAALVSFFERRKDKKADTPAQLPGDTQVVAASFVDKRALGDLTASILAMHGTLNVLIGHVEKLNERMHEQDMLTALAAKMREERR